MLNEAKTSRPRPELRGQGRGQDYEVEAEDEAKNNYERITKWWLTTYDLSQVKSSQVAFNAMWNSHTVT